MRRHLQQRLRGGFIVYSVLLSLLLVIATTGSVAIILSRALNEQVARAADARLAAAATQYRGRMDTTRGDLQAAGNWLAKDLRLLAAVGIHRPAEVRRRLALTLSLRAVDEVTLADPRGHIVARAPAGKGSVAGAALRAALLGRWTYGVTRD